MSPNPRELKTLISNVSVLWLFLGRYQDLREAKYEQLVATIHAFLEALNNERFRLVTLPGEKDSE